ncbi:MAG TPA: serine hydroxymethyltransferase, partial [Candidatus Dojkabacteria bacterium]|nr:serine hydroxymethyltransferase [Candidatus Dojkabacteria bacterium]
MGMSLDSGGHLTHGFKVSFSGSFYNAVNYGVDSNGYINYDEILSLAQKAKPKLIWAGFSAYSRILDWKKFREISDEVGAYLVADISHVAGLIASGVYPSPVGFADVITTTTHKTLRGPRGAMILSNDEEIAQKIDKAIFPGLQGGPHNHITAGIAVALKEASTDEFKKYSQQVVINAKKLAESLSNLGYKIISGGTDNHLFLVDMVSSVGLSGKEVGDILDSVGITVNKNAIPNDGRKPWDPSGIRIGTPALTTRGMKEKEMEIVAQFIDRAIKNSKNKEEMKKIKNEIVNFTKVFKIPGIQ